MSRRPLSRRELQVAREAAEKSRAYAIEIATTIASTYRECGSDDAAAGIESVINYLTTADFGWRATQQ